MKNLLSIALVALSIFTAQAQVSETRQNHSAYNRIEVQNGIQLMLTQGDNAAMTVMSDNQRALDEIVTEVVGNCLKIYIADREPGSSEIARFTTLKVYVTHKDIAGLKATAGASITTTGEIKAGGLAIQLESGASFRGKIKCEGALKVTAKAGSSFDGIVTTNTFDGNMFGGSTVKLAGIASNAVLHATTGATCLGANFICQKATIDARKTSAVVINVKDTIKASADNTASITYYGAPVNSDLGSNSFAFIKK